MKLYKKIFSFIQKKNLCVNTLSSKHKMSSQKLNSNNNNLSRAHKKFELMESEVNDLRILNILKTKKYFDTIPNSKEALNKFFQNFENNWGNEIFEIEHINEKLILKTKVQWLYLDSEEKLKRIYLFHCQEPFLCLSRKLVQECFTVDELKQLYNKNNSIVKNSIDEKFKIFFFSVLNMAYQEEIEIDNLPNKFFHEYINNLYSNQIILSIIDVIFLLNCKVHFFYKSLQPLLIESINGIYYQIIDLKRLKNTSNINNDCKLMIENFYTILNYYLGLGLLDTLNNKTILDNMLISLINLHNIIFKDIDTFILITFIIFNNFNYLSNKILILFADLINHYLNSGYFDKFEEFDIICVLPSFLNLQIYLKILNRSTVLKCYEQIYKMFNKNIRISKEDHFLNYLQSFLNVESSLFHYPKIFEDEELHNLKIKIFDKSFELYKNHKSELNNTIKPLCIFLEIYSVYFEKNYRVKEIIKNLKNELRFHINHTNSPTDMVEFLVFSKTWITKEEKNLCISKIISNIHLLKKLSLIRLAKIIQKMRELEISDGIIKLLKTDYMNKLVTSCLINKKFTCDIPCHLRNLMEFTKTYEKRLIIDRSNIQKDISHGKNIIDILEKSDLNLNEDSNNNHNEQNNILMIIEKIYFTLSEDKNSLKLFGGRKHFINRMITLTFSENPKLLSKYYMNVIFPLNFHKFILKKYLNQIKGTLIHLEEMIDSLYIISSLEQSPNKNLILAVHLKYIVKLLLLTIKGFENRYVTDIYVMKVKFLLNQFYNVYLLNSRPFAEMEKQFPKCQFVRFILRKRYLLMCDIKNLKVNTPDYIQQYLNNQKKGQKIVDNSQKNNLL